MKCQNSGVLGINQQDKGRKNGQRPKYKVAIAFILGRGKEEEEEVRNMIEARNLGREGEAEKRWAAGPLLLSRAHFLEKFFEDSWMEWGR